MLSIIYIAYVTAYITIYVLNVDVSGSTVLSYLLTNLYWWIFLYNELVMYKCLSCVRGLQYLVLPSFFLVSKEYLCHSMQKTLDVRYHISWISVYLKSHTAKRHYLSMLLFFCYSCIIYVAYTFKVSNYAHANCLWGVFWLLALLSEGLELGSLLQPWYLILI